METIKVKYLDDTLPTLSYIGGMAKSNWVDLYLAEDVDLVAGTGTYAPLGVAMELPEGYEAIVAPRSSAFKNYGVLMSNSIGVIDESYCGDGDEWKLPLYATKDVHIPKGTRLCQFRIAKHQPVINFETVDRLSNPDREGIGSTGL